VNGIQLVKISTLNDAIGALKALAAGTGDVPACTR
jgi:PDZ domain-containing protein